MIDIQSALNELKNANDAAFASADPTKKGCFGLLVTPEDPHPVCRDCEFFESCKLAADENLIANGQVLEDQINMEHSLTLLNDQIDALDTFKPEPEDEPGPTVEPQPEPTADTEINIEVKTRKSTPPEMVGYDWRITIAHILEKFPQTVAATTHIVRADLTAIGVNKPQMNFWRTYTLKILCALEDHGKLNWNRDNLTVTWN